MSAPDYKTLTKTVIARVTDFGRKPISEYQALHQARLLLEEEGRWCSGSLFEDGDPEPVFENGSFCGTWQVCAAGAVGIVTGDMPIKITKEWFPGDHEREAFYEWEDPIDSVVFAPDTLSFKALQILAIAINLDREEIELNNGGIWRYEDDREVTWLDDPTSVVFNGNDNSNRQAVIDHFKSAEALAQDKKKLAKIKSDIQLTKFTFEVEVFAKNDEVAVTALASRLDPKVEGHAIFCDYNADECCY